MPRSPSRLLDLFETSPGTAVGAELPVRSLVFDVLTAAVLAGLGAVLLAVIARFERPIDFVFVVAVCAPLALRRRLPRASLLIALAVGLVQMLLGVRIGIYDAALLFALYTAVGTTARRFGLGALVAGLLLALVGGLTGWWEWVDRQLGTPGPVLRAVSTLGVACWSSPPGRWGSGCARPGSGWRPWPNGSASWCVSGSSRPSSSPPPNGPGSRGRCTT